MAKDSLYKYTNKFELITDGGATVTDIEEPIGWADQDTVLTRDPKWHGVNFEFTDADIQLGFDCAAGKSILEGIYNLEGNDGLAFLRFSSFIDGVWVAMPDFKLDFNFYDNDFTQVSFTLKRTSFEDLFRSRFSIAHDITSSEDLDGNAITPLASIDLEMHSKELFLQTDREFSDSNPIVGTPPLKTSDLLELRFEDDPILPTTTIPTPPLIQHREQIFYAQPSFGKINIDDIKENQNIPFGVSLTGPNPQYILDDDGILTLDLDLIYNASVYLSNQWRGSRASLRVDGCSRDSASEMSNAKLELVVQIAGIETILVTEIKDSSGCDLTMISFGNSGYFNDPGLGAPFSNALKNDMVNLDIVFPTNFDNTAINAKLISSGTILNHTQAQVIQSVQKGDEVAVFIRISVDGDYRRHGLNSSDLGWMVHAAFYNEDLEITPNISSLKMSLNSVEEITNSDAYLLHETLDKSLEIVTGINARLRSDLLGRISLGYDSDGCASKNTILNGFSIRNFDVANRPPNTSIEDYLNSIQAIYNIGYGLGKDSGDDVLIVEGAEHFYQNLEIRTVLDPYDYRETVDSENIINEIEIGYSTFQEDGINLLDEPNTRRRYITPIKTEKRKLDIISDYISSGYTIEIQRRDQFNTSPSESLDYDDKIFIVAVRLDGPQWKSERDEDFTTVNNVFSPSTAYNLKLTPKRMLYRWARFLKSSLRYKNQATELIKFVFGFKNNELETQTSNSCEQSGLIKESNDVLLNAFPNSSNALFSPEKIEFKEKLSWPNFEIIRKALKGESLINNNFGYIRVKDPEENFKIGWVTELRYNISSQEASYTLRKKWQ